MRKFSIFFSSLLLLLTLTTFNPNNIDTSFQLFKIKNIEIKNLKILDKNKIRNSFYNELQGTNLLIIDERKIKNILKDYDLIDYIEFKKVYPSKIQIIIHEKETIAIINNCNLLSGLTKIDKLIQSVKVSGLISRFSSLIIFDISNSLSSFINFILFVFFIYNSHNLL